MDTPVLTPSSSSSIVGFLLHDVARLMRRRFEQRAIRLGFTRAQWQVLVHLAQNEGIHQAGLADILEVEPITLVRILDKLQARGLIERRQHPNDRRCLVTLSHARGAPEPRAAAHHRRHDACRSPGGSRRTRAGCPGPRLDPSQIQSCRGLHPAGERRRGPPWLTELPHATSAMLTQRRSIAIPIVTRWHRTDTPRRCGGHPSRSRRRGPNGWSYLRLPKGRLPQPRSRWLLRRDASAVCDPSCSRYSRWLWRWGATTT